MGIFDRFKNIRNESRQGSLEQLIDMLGIGSSDTKAMSEATYYACIKILAESIGKLPLKIMKRSEDGQGRVEYVEHPLYRVLRDRPNPLQTASSFWASMEMDKQHNGNAICYIKRNGKNVTLWQLPWENVKVFIDDKRILGEDGWLWYIYTDPKTQNIYKFHPDEVLHFKTSISEDGITGVPVRESLSKIIRTSSKGQEMLSKLYENGFTAKAVLQYTGNLDDRSERKLIEHIQNYAEGKVSTGRSIIPIPLGMTIQPLNIKLTDAQFAEVSKLTSLQIAAAFGIKPDQINDYEKSSYASSEAQQLAFYVDKLLYELKGIEEEINYKLLYTTRDKNVDARAKFNVAVILRADIKTQIESLTSGIQHGIYTPNEARALLDMAGKEGGDMLLVNSATVRLKDLEIEKEINA